MKSAFRNLGIKPEDWKYLVMKAVSPIDGKTYYFVDKCLPFGASISCSHFQRFSNAVKHIVQWKAKKSLVNYLDDYLFAALRKLLCNIQVKIFLEVCSEISFPVSLEKTFWASTKLPFLGLLIDTINQCVCIPVEKVKKAICLIDSILEMRDDLRMWLTFLQHPRIFCRPFLDFSTFLVADEIDMYSDASGRIGMGAICGDDWVMQMWDTNFINKYKPSIEYLELYAVTAAVLLWINQFRNKRIILFCDNESVVNMINYTTTSCKNCMVLIRIIVLKGLLENIRIFARHVQGVKNDLADSLSRDKLELFFNLCDKKGRKMNKMPHKIPEAIWPMDKIWKNK